jgi:hypothetical protein
MYELLFRKATFVPKERLELSSLSATVSKTAVSTNSTTRALINVVPPRIELGTLL